MVTSSLISSPDSALVNGNGKQDNSIINLNQGDPTMFEAYWKEEAEKSRVIIEGWQRMSYYSEDFAGKASKENTEQNLNICWFMVAPLEEQIRRVHRLVGNAVTDGRYIVVGSGTMQLYQAALYAYALSIPVDTPDSPHPISVVCAAPYYSSYPSATNYLKSELYRWAGDAHTFDAASNEPYIEIITSPNNPDGFIRKPVVEGSAGKGLLIHDLAYYWPHYTAISAALDDDLMLFTLSKATGHAGSRVGWAIVKDREMALRMIKFLENATIGVSKDSQVRASKILNSVCDSLEPEAECVNFFKYGRSIMADRWSRFRKVIESNGSFTVPDYPKQFCNFTGEFIGEYPSFAFLKLKEEETEKDAEEYMRKHNILTRGGKNFGVDSRYVRVSMLDREETFSSFLERIDN